MKRTHLSLYQKAAPVEQSSDGRVNAHHQRYARSFVPVQMGNHTIKYWPLKSCPNDCGVTQMTLRTWIKDRVLVVPKMYRMWVMTRAEMRAIGLAVRQHRAGTERHCEITPEFLETLNANLQEVRYALDKLKRRMKLTDRETEILQPTLQEK